MASGIKTETEHELGMFFPKNVRDQGKYLYRNRLVTNIDGDDDWAEAEVIDGPTIYAVRCEVSKEGPSILECSCACNAATKQYLLCKHIWAVTLAALQKGYLAGDLDNPLFEIALVNDRVERSWNEGRQALGNFDLGNASDLQRLVALFHEKQQKSNNGTRAIAAPKPPPVPEWKRVVQSLAALANEPIRTSQGWGINREVVYCIESDGIRDGEFKLQLQQRDKKKDGEWGKPKSGPPNQNDLPYLPAVDREIVSSLYGATRPSYDYYSSYGATATYSLNAYHRESLLPRMAATGRLFLKEAGRCERPPLSWDGGEPWQFEIQTEKVAKKNNWRVFGQFVRGSESRLLTGFEFLYPVGVFVHGTTVGRVDFQNAYDWVKLLLRQREIHIPADQFHDFLTVAHAKGVTPPLRLPTELGVATVDEPLRPLLRVKKNPNGYPADSLRAELVFRYGEVNIPSRDARSAAFDAEKKVLVRRDRNAEQTALARIDTLGLKPPMYNETHYTLTSKKLPEVARSLISEGWNVEAEGKLYRSAGTFEMGVASGIDWFELRGQVDFDGRVVQLPKILEAVRNRQTMVDLGDGEVGILPEEWIKKYALLAGAGEKQKDHVRFGRNQVGLLDALLLSQPEVDIDAKYREARERFRSFKGIEASPPPPSFVGELRPYQAEGLGWLKFLREFGFGGCLADDMGLGKTIQVLALLADHVTTKPKRDRRPNLVVVPKSLIFNWKAEATKFAPQLTVLDYTGTERKKDPAVFSGYDLVLTTYGTLRMDAALLKDVAFDYGILDESQAIKNAASESAKACRLLNCRHRLAMSGTPIENHLGELGSLFEYLNPGMLGRATAMQLIGGAGRGADDESRTILSHALRPYMLRRTKDQVAKDLPQKTEQTVFCELEPKQRKVYDDLKEYYRKSILGAVDAVGLNKSKIQILEALLRLRQAACHPGLLDKEKIPDPSAKLDSLLPQLTDVFEEGHKALVFSQFTSFLDIVKKRLDADKIPYEYLDGKTPTTQRQAKVEKFQSDPTCKLFLISLKAGGVGLNLTAAEYVFLLDPWWNPAVEAQAVDRAHRIGQTKPVFAYRYIAKDTVEEKVLALQQSKKALADSIINADNNLIRSLKREDLELLLS